MAEKGQGAVESFLLDELGFEKLENVKGDFSINDVKSIFEGGVMLQLSAFNYAPRFKDSIYLLPPVFDLAQRMDPESYVYGPLMAEARKVPPKYEYYIALRFKYEATKKLFDLTGRLAGRVGGKMRGWVQKYHTGEWVAREAGEPVYHERSANPWSVDIEDKNFHARLEVHYRKTDQHGGFALLILGFNSSREFVGALRESIDNFNKNTAGIRKNMSEGSQNQIREAVLRAQATGDALLDRAKAGRNKIRHPDNRVC